MGEDGSDDDGRPDRLPRRARVRPAGAEPGGPTRLPPPADRRGTAGAEAGKRPHEKRRGRDPPLAQRTRARAAHRAPRQARRGHRQTADRPQAPPADRRLRRLGQLPELLPDAVVEVRARQLGEPADGLLEADLQLGARGELSRPLPVEGDLDRLAPGRVSDVQRIARRDHQSARGERVRRDEADHIPLHAPGEDRTGVGEVVAGRSGGGRGDQPVAADVADLLLPDRVGELRDPPVRAPDEADVVEGDRQVDGQLGSERREVQYLVVAGEGAAQAVGELLPLDRGQEADRAEVDPEYRDAGVREAAQRVEDAAVAAEHEADVRALAVGDPLDVSCLLAVLLMLVGRADQLHPCLAGRLGGDGHRVRGALGVSGSDQHRARHGSTLSIPATRSISAPLRAAQTKVSRFPFGPGSPEEATPRITSPSARAPWATLRIASRRSAASRTTPPLPTFSFSSSNCGLTSPRRSNSSAAHATIGGTSFASEMNETSTVIKSGRYGRYESPRLRALRRSMTSTRESCRSRQSSCP